MLASEEWESFHPNFSLLESLIIPMTTINTGFEFPVIMAWSKIITEKFYVVYKSEILFFILSDKFGANN